MWHKAIPALAVVVGAISGCNNADPTTTTQPSTTAALTTSADSDAVLWDPCSLPDAALTDAGLNTATQQTDIGGVKFEGWKICSWTDVNKTYTFGILTSAHTLGEIRQRTDYGDFTDTQVDGKTALQYRWAGSRRDFSCKIAVEAPSGTIDFDILVRHSSRDTAADPCVEVRRLADELIDEIPIS
ncbi:DUF3558 domain-containing protein [Nocardia sp. MW-W600-9]